MGGVLPEPVTTGRTRTASTLPDNLVQPARTLLNLLTTLSAFGATLAFSAMYSSLASAPTYLAWAFAAFIVGLAETLVCQVVLVADFQGFSGRIYRSPAGILAGITIGFASIITGSILVCLSMTKNAIYGVRAAGYTASALVALLVCASLCRLAFAIRRRSQLLASSEGRRVPGTTRVRTTAAIVVATPSESTETIATLESSRVNETQIPVSVDPISSTTDWDDDPALAPRQQWVEEPGGTADDVTEHVLPVSPGTGGDLDLECTPQEGEDRADTPGTPVSADVVTGPVCFQHGD